MQRRAVPLLRSRARPRPEHATADDPARLNAAAQNGATVISNSWGTDEIAFDGDLTTAESYFDHPGVAVFASTGDNGYDNGGAAAVYPSVSAFTIAVGGTTLVQDSTTPRGWSETAWSMGGASCSMLIAKPAWQTSSPCTMRAAADVAAVGDPGTGVAVYNQAGGGWGVVGGTSAASPLVAAMFAQTSNGAKTAEYTYQVPLFGVTSGTDGTCGNKLCEAGAGWNGPAGNGTPNGAVLAGAKAPILTIDSPLPGQFVPPGYPIQASCTTSDGTTIREVDVSVDGESLAQLTAAPYTANAPAAFVNGKAIIDVTCTASSLVQVSQSLVVYQTQACSHNADCGTSGDICYLGACIAGPSAAEGLGATCTGDSACSSGTCAAAGSEAHCSIPCATNGAACPSGFSCITGGGSDTLGDCWPSSGGGCNAGGRGGPLGVLLVLGTWLAPRITRRRRRA